MWIDICCAFCLLFFVFFLLFFVLFCFLFLYFLLSFTFVFLCFIYVYFLLFCLYFWFICFLFCFIFFCLFLFCLALLRFFFACCTARDCLSFVSAIVFHPSLLSCVYELVLSVCGRVMGGVLVVLWVLFCVLGGRGFCVFWVCGGLCFFVLCVWSTLGEFIKKETNKKCKYAPNVCKVKKVILARADNIKTQTVSIIISLCFTLIPPMLLELTDYNVSSFIIAKHFSTKTF